MRPSSSSAPRGHHGHATRTDEQRASYRERQNQELLAAARGTAHVGAVFEDDG
jgi:UPF0176 protein